MHTFKQAMQSRPLAISAELTLKRESTAADVAAQAGLLGPLVDAVQVNDNPLAWVQMSALAASSLLLQSGVDAIPILTCRDRNVIGLHSDLLGLRALGVTSLVLMRGRRVGRKHALHASTVFDLTGRELIALASALDEGGPPAPGGGFLIGTGARAYRAKRGWAAESLVARAEAGAQFLQTQICLNPGLVGHWMQRLVEAQVTWRYSVIVSVAVLPSAQTARWVKDNMSDSKIPNALIKRLEQAADPEREGIDICAEVMRGIAEIPGISGINLVSTGSPEHMAAAIEASGLRNAGSVPESPGSPGSG